MNRSEVVALRKESENHLVNELLPFWTVRMKDGINGGYITHFDKNGKDTGEDEKSLISQTRCLYTVSSAYRSGYGMDLIFLLTKCGMKIMAGFSGWLIAVEM